MKIRTSKTLMMIFAAALLHGCVTVQSISVSQIPEASQRKHVVTATASSPVVFAIPFNNDYIDEARSNLLNQCPNGVIEGLLSKHENSNYFVGLVYMQRVKFQGYCNQKVAMTHSKAKRKG